MSSSNINNNTFEEIKEYYDNVLNKDKTTYKTSNDEPTPIDCVIDILDKIPEDLWSKKNLKILDPCAGNGNFSFIAYNKLIPYHSKKDILENILYFNDINEDRLNNIKDVFCSNEYKLNISKSKFEDYKPDIKFDAIIGNPPYAKILDNGKRASKNHNLIKDFIELALNLLNSNGYLAYITPDNWMSISDRNTLITRITELQIIHLDIHSAKKYFPKVGSSFTYYVIQNNPFYKDINISGVYNGEYYNSQVKSEVKHYIPLFYNKIVQSILSKTIDKDNTKFIIKSSSDLHRYTKKNLISNTQDDEFRFKLIHTPTQICYANRPHKFQSNWKVFIPTTTYYSKMFIDECGMTQSILFLICSSKNEAVKLKNILLHPLFQFIISITRYGNFNNQRIIQKLPFYDGDYDKLYEFFNITNDEIELIKKYI